MLRPGDSFERYQVDELIGQGGMGCVYRAHDARLGRRVALKVISDGAASPEAKARLAREARAAAALDHPNAVAIFDVGEVDGSPFIVMELVSGRTLREAMGTGRMPMATRIGWLQDVARVLAAAHKRGLVHRDIKPENVMVRDDGVVKVLDFGIARRSQAEIDPHGATAAPALPTLTRDGVNLGTPMYMAPEQIKGDPLDGRADQFAWGVVAYELCTGRVPWRGADTLGALASILTDDPAEAPLDAPGVPPETKATILRALSKRAADRFATMDDLLRTLERGAASAPPPAPTAARSDGRAAGPTLPTGPRPAPDPSPPRSATDARRYSTQEVRDILSRAVERQAQEPDSGLRFDDLLAAAREVGVEENVLRDASREIRKRDEPLPTSEPRATPALTPSRDEDAGFEIWRRRKRRGFYRHLGIYLIVNGALLLMGLLTDRPQMAAGGIVWAIALGIHAMSALFASRDEWTERRERTSRKERREQERLDRRLERKRRREAVVDRAIEEGASLLLAAGAKVRQRLAGAATKATTAVTTAATNADGAAGKAAASTGKPRVRVDDRPEGARIELGHETVAEHPGAGEEPGTEEHRSANAKR